MDMQPPPLPAGPRGKTQWRIIDKLRKARGQSLLLPKGTTNKTKTELRAIRALEAKGIVIIMGDRYARRR
jgi:hypothetical protein